MRPGLPSPSLDAKLAQGSKSDATAPVLRFLNLGQRKKPLESVRTSNRALGEAADG